VATPDSPPDDSLPDGFERLVTAGSGQTAGQTALNVAAARRDRDVS
jgi:hypothetical protein